jgi:murein DD-endopeptidase MepM/ murein hydrolase activator NlpD
MLNTILTKISFYILLFIFSVTILAYASLMVEKHANNNQVEYTKNKNSAITLSTTQAENITLSAGKEIVFMDNIPIKNGNLSSKYGIRKDPFNGKKRMHHGIDIAAQKGTHIYPLGRGKVIFSGRKSGYGNLVEILHGESTISRYAHIKKSLVKKGQFVGKKDIIALVGNTGRSTGPHLHLEIAINGVTVDPEIFLIGHVAYYDTH